MTNAKPTNQHKHLEAETSLHRNDNFKSSVSLEVGQTSDKGAMKDAIKERDRIARFICIFLLVVLAFCCGLWAASKPPDVKNAVSIVILERPQPPQQVFAKLLDQQNVQLDWTADHDGNVRIDSYLVEVRTFNEDNTTQVGWKVALHNIPADSTSVIVPMMLDSPGLFEFRMKAKNGIGISKPSLPTPKAILVGPHAPTWAPKILIPIKQYEDYQQEDISFDLSAPFARRDLITGYRLRQKYRQLTFDDNWIVFNKSDLASNWQYSNHTNETHIGWKSQWEGVFHIQVAAENKAGVGPYSESAWVCLQGRNAPQLIVWLTSPTDIVVMWNVPDFGRLYGHVSRDRYPLTTVDSSSEPWRLRGISSDSEYFITVGSISQTRWQVKVKTPPS